MKSEELREEYPQMPEELKNRVSMEVEKQMRSSGPIFTARRIAVAAVAATLCIGTTVAAAELYKLHGEKTGQYGLETTMETEGQPDGTGITNEGEINIPKVRIELGYLPDGMAANSEAMDHYSYAETPWQGGISICLIRMDQGDEVFQVLDKNVLESEDIKAGVHSGVYLRRQGNIGGGINMDQKIYLSFPEVHYIAEIAIGEDVTKEEALKIAEGMKLICVEAGENPASEPATIDWSVYSQNMSAETDEDESAVWSPVSSIAKSEIPMYMPGDTFDIGMPYEGGNVTLQVKVKDVTVMDNISGLDERFLSDTIWEVTDEAGNLLPNTRNYLKEGDGVDTISEVVDTRVLPQKMVVVTMEYKNTTEDDLRDILFFNTVTAIDEVDENYVIAKETPAEGEEWDFYQDSADLAQCEGEMIYYTVRGGENQNGSNYISSLKAGETITLETGFLVNEEDLKHLYLSADPYGIGYGFDEYVSKSGFVNISN